MLDHLKSSDIIWDRLGSSGSIWENLRSGIIWRSSGIIRVSDEIIWDHLGIIWLWEGLWEVSGRSLRSLWEALADMYAPGVTGRSWKHKCQHLWTKMQMAPRNFSITNCLWRYLQTDARLLTSNRRRRRCSTSHTWRYLSFRITISTQKKTIFIPCHLWRRKTFSISLERDSSSTLVHSSKRKAFRPLRGLHKENPNRSGTLFAWSRIKELSSQRQLRSPARRKSSGARRRSSKRGKQSEKKTIFRSLDMQPILVWDSCSLFSDKLQPGPRTGCNGRLYSFQRCMQIQAHIHQWLYSAARGRYTSQCKLLQTIQTKPQTSHHAHVSCL